MSSYSRQRLEDTYNQVVEAALRKRRCPDNASINSAQLTALARQGRLRIDISGRSYRTVHVLTGPHAGLSTLPDPDKGRVFKSIGVVSTSTLRRKQYDRNEPRQVPSLPRLSFLEKEDIEP